MCKMPLNFAVPGAIISLLKHGALPEELTITTETVLNYTKYLEQVTGQAVLNDFTRLELEEYMSHCLILVDTLTGFKLHLTLIRLKMNHQKDLTSIIQCIFDYFDPPLNFPMEILKHSNMFDEL